MYFISNILNYYFKYFSQNGLVVFGPKEKMNQYINTIDLSGISAHVITNEEAKEKFPIFNIPDDFTVIFDPIAGVLRADRCLKALLVSCY